MRELRDLEGPGGRGRGAPDRPMGMWSARPELPGLEGTGQGVGRRGNEAEPQTAGGAGRRATPKGRDPDRLREK